MQPIDGEIIVVDKPLGWSSFHVVKKLRGILSARLRHVGVKKLKVGHAGTLDPLATGIMIVCTGKATKQIDSLQSGVKEYVTTIKLGATTPSFDRETPENAIYPFEHITRELIDETLKQFVGTISQRPPEYSACKIEGHRAYKIARKGETVELKPKTLTIDEIEVLDFKPPLLKLRIVCSKGTYIRALARDIGSALGSGGYLHNLCRTRVGNYLLADALPIARAVELLSIVPCTITSENNIEIQVPIIPFNEAFLTNDKADIKPFDER